MKQAILKNNGAISHHHGIGMDHKEYRYRSPEQLSIVKALKDSLDPQGIMNPGKVL